ncbi:hypothetical protein ALC62_00043, partial [Cyphomyrmex costatus]
QAAQEARYTTRGAVVREWPRTRDVGLQHRPRACERATQTDPPEIPRRPTGRSRSRGSEERHSEDRRERTPRPNLADGERGRPRGKVSEGRESGATSTNIHGCWNCHEEGHRYSECPWKRREFCFGCGRRGETLRTCPRCGQRWRNLGPYHPSKGHDLRRE